MTPRTLSNWKAAGPEGAKRSPGRPPHSPEVRRAALWAIAREVQRQGWKAGWRKIHEALAQSVPIRLVQRLLGALKRPRRAVVRRRRERVRMRIEVRYRDAVWSQDATHLGRCASAAGETVQDRNGSPEGGPSPADPCPPRTDRGRARRKHTAVLGEVLRDVASTRTIQLAVGPPANGAEIVTMLERACAQRGGPPLVYCTDNGSQYTCAEVAQWLAAHAVVHLRNVPHTPQHNPWVERGHRELKEDAELGKAARIESVAHAARALERARERIDECRPRTTRGNRTPLACDVQNEPWYAAASRERFYQSACHAVAEAVQGIESARARRRAEREAILATLERFGLVRRTRGGAPVLAFKQEEVS